MNESFLGGALTINNAIFDALIAGTGAAGYNAAVHLYDRGVSALAILSENRLGGTSRNAGSDKQTYYKVSCAGAEGDSCREMAETLFAGGSMDGDLALCEASHSLEEFFHLVSIGVEFPHNKYGEFAGYKTDHDPRQRASSTGPYTSKHMTERLEAEVMRRNIRIIDKTRVIKVLVDRAVNRAYGVLCLENGKNFVVYLARNIIFATGGPAGIYGMTVYPQEQFGASGVLVKEGVAFANIAEWQYGIGSVAFRWNLSGSYQQAIPRYVSVDKDGVEREFLSRYFSNIRSLSRAVFLKGYQWPFNPEYIQNEGSSLIDYAVYVERHINGNRTYLDFTRNAERNNAIGFFLPDDIDPAAHEYLKRSGALGGTPLERLMRLNPAAYRLYKSHNIDLARDLLEIDVLPQHHNGGAAVNIWWETSIKHLFAVGECAGTHGFRRPGGSALNAGQVGGLRAAKYIAAHLKFDAFFETKDAVEQALEAAGKFEREFVTGGGGNAEDLLRRIQGINTVSAGFLRAMDNIDRGIEAIENLEVELCGVNTENHDPFFRVRETRLFSLLLLGAIRYYIGQGGQSRGSYLIMDKTGGVEPGKQSVPEQSILGLPILGLPFLIDNNFGGSILISHYDPETGQFVHRFRPVHPIPESETWFETVWHEYSTGKIFNGE
ncbi:MAG: FAD-binding protein [Treponema sp.]|jgi:succinate dehydrogenase/fumarate reductase flavoprotein subunit|nr:FAD-binding protein [Treponema sp.]